ncbi:MAG TPA: OmpA family protein [bacterium]|mgnify:CR=1 FL=1|nr:OmpA family protein [bacterium]HPS30510.1 OmpA family protein [bacterium]
MKRILLTASVLVMLFALSSCGINKEVHQKALNDLATAQKSYKDQEGINTALKKENKKLTAELDALKKDMLVVIDEKMALNRTIADLNQRNLDSADMVDALVLQLKQKGATLEDVEAKRSELDQTRQKMLEERDRLLKEQDSLKGELAQVRKMKEAAEKRNAEYQQLMSKLKSMIDAGKLTVNIRKGRMIVSLSSDILFPSGKTTLTDEGKAALAELSETLKTLEDRSFLVVGHSDSTPIKTSRFPSNWELSSQRAIEVARLMIDNGVKPEMLTAAGQAEFDAIADNDTPENKAKNRRVEIVFLPKIEELPGFTQ